MFRSTPRPPLPSPALVLALAGLLLVVARPRGSFAQEAWADPDLPVQDALVFWLDPARQASARRERGLPLLADGSLLSVAFDASGTEHHFVQSDRRAQPVFLETTIAGAKVAAIRFDGDDDHLHSSKAAPATEFYTAFIVARLASNTGGFRALLAGQALGKNDYTSGFNIDLGFVGTATWSTLNVEGPGYGGAVDLLRDDQVFDDAFHIIAVRAAGEEVALSLDGRRQDSRPRDVLPAALDQMTLGARIYCNTGEPPFVTGFVDGAIAELLLYRKALTDDEETAVTKYLRRKHAPLLAGIAFGSEKSTAALDDSRVRLVPELPGEPNGPPIEVLVPGFKVAELPVELRNVNNLRYRTRRQRGDGDGGAQLVALGYDGRIFLLGDSDGDELEDEAAVFWDRPTLRSPIGMALTPPGYDGGFGVFVASKGKVSLIVDSDGDDRADREIVVADGWTELPHGVDALGVALAPDGALYFGLGCANYTNAYLVDPATRRSAYQLTSARGTILRVSPDFARREVVCTGIRFPVALQFNEHGDLFATDQEGETWLPGGNPRDELLHILPSRHYGFPPRHPRYLPDVVDEPSVFDYGPQHQSTCGFVFNEPESDQARFGPEHFDGDAFVAGYSRGIIYRTKLHRQEGEIPRYTARTSLFARLGLLTVDACISPRGDLVVATHSGGPDWGSGPQGEGKLFRIRYEDRSVPQPVVAWAESPIETRIAFDRELDPELLDGAELAITYGDAVRAADRFEVHRPGYEVVREQLASPRHRLEIEALLLSSNRRTLIVRTRPHPYRTHYAIRASFPAKEAARAKDPSESGTRFDIDYDLCGVEAHWRGDPQWKGEGMTPATTWSGWLPHIEPAASITFLAGSARRAELERVIATPGELALRTAIGSFSEPRTLIVRSSGAFRAGFDGELHEAGTVGPSRYELRLALPAEREASLVEVRFATGRKENLTNLAVTLEDRRDGIERPLSAQAQFAPWSAPRSAFDGLAGGESSDARATAAPRASTRDELDGHWLRGEEIFFGEGRCGTCHRIRGRGREIGPDLSNLIYRDVISVSEDIAMPSARIHPDYVSYTVVTKKSAVWSGLLRSRPDGKLSIFDTNGGETVLDPEEIAAFEPNATSLMPEKLDEVLGKEKLQDLLTFLLVPPPSMPNTTVQGGVEPPPPRSEREVRDALAGSADLSAALDPIHIVLVAGPKDHGPGEHDYPAWQEVWERLLGLAGGVRVTTAWIWPEPEDFEAADAIVFFQQGAWDGERAKAIDAFLARGGGLVYLHYAVDGGGDPSGFAERIGLAWQGGRSRFRHGDLELRFDGDAAHTHPIARNFERLRLHDESYWELVGDPTGVDVIATSIEDSAPRPLLWTRAVGRGRVFVSILGHFSTTFDDPLFRILVLRGIAWCAHEPVDRLNALVWPGAAIVYESREGAGAEASKPQIRP